MPKNKMSDLRDHLFETLEALKDKEQPLELDRAKAICAVADTLIESAKVEVQYLKVTGRGEEGSKSPFLDGQNGADARPRLAEPAKGLSTGKNFGAA
jgi:hypothetical protein